MPIRRATRADLTQLCVTAMRAFAEDPVMRWLFPDDDQFFQPAGEVLRGAMTGWVEHNEVWCTDDAAALAVWIQPGRPETPENTDPSLAPPSPELLDRFGTIGPLMADHTPSEDHWYL